MATDFDLGFNAGMQWAFVYAIKGLQGKGVEMGAAYWERVKEDEQGAENCLDGVVATSVITKWLEEYFDKVDVEKAKQEWFVLNATRGL